MERWQTPVQSMQGSEVRGAVSFPLFPHCFPNKNEISSPAAAGDYVRGSPTGRGLYVQMGIRKLTRSIHFCVGLYCAQVLNSVYVQPLHSRCVNKYRSNFSIFSRGWEKASDPYLCNITKLEILLKGPTTQIYNLFKSTNNAAISLPHAECSDGLIRGIKGVNKMIPTQHLTYRNNLCNREKILISFTQTRLQ